MCSVWCGVMMVTMQLLSNLSTVDQCTGGHVVQGNHGPGDVVQESV